MQDAPTDSRRAKTGRWLALALLGCLLTPITGGGHPKLAVGDVPPGRLGVTAAGERVDLGAYRGRVVIISFWATWCSPCRKEMTALAALQRHVSKDQLIVLAINWREDRRTFVAIKKVLKERDVDLTLISDDMGHLGKQYDVDAIPHMIIVGRDGRIAAIHLGYGEDEIPELVDEINGLLAKSPES